MAASQSNQSNAYKRIIFFDDKSKESLISLMKAAGYQGDDFDEACDFLFLKLKEDDLQRFLGIFIRRLAIHHLKTSTSDLCKNLRNQYETQVATLKPDPSEGNYPSLDEFYAGQSENSRYATYMECLALSEALNLNLVITSTDVEDKATPRGTCEYYSNSSNMGTIHLYNRPGYHYYVDEGAFYSTIADGNCFYYGVAQHVRYFVLLEKLQQTDTDNLEFLQELLHDNQRQRPLAQMSSILMTYFSVVHDNAASDTLHSQNVVLEGMKDRKLPAKATTIKTSELCLNTRPNKTSSEEQKEALNHFKTYYQDLLNQTKSTLNKSKNDNTQNSSKNEEEMIKEMLAVYDAMFELSPPGNELNVDKILDSLISDCEDTFAPELNEQKLNTDYLGFLLQYLEPYTPLLLGLAIGVVVTSSILLMTSLSVIPSLALGAISVFATERFFSCSREKIDDSEEKHDCSSLPYSGSDFFGNCQY